MCAMEQPSIFFYPKQPSNDQVWFQIILFAVLDKAGLLLDAGVGGGVALVDFASAVVGGTVGFVEGDWGNKLNKMRLHIYISIIIINQRSTGQIL